MAAPNKVGAIMKVRNLGYALNAGAVLALLAGCGGSQSQSVAPSVMPQDRGIGAPPTRSGSWMLPEAAATKELAYLSEVDGAVIVYAYPSGKVVGKITALHNPQGSCVDAEGNVFITDFGRTEVVEFAHGGTKPIRTMSTNGAADACSVAPDGDLAVANSHNLQGLVGNVAIFSGASGSPKHFINKRCHAPSSVGYDGAGNLYIESAYSPVICEVVRNGTFMKVVKSNVTLKSPLGVMWDGKHITLADNYYTGSVTETVVYQMRESKFGDLREVGKTVLTGSCGNRTAAHNPFILGQVNTPQNKSLANLVVSANSFCTNYLFTWSYPGGALKHSSRKSAVTLAQAISIAE